jgi:hypothetical protein
MSGYITRESRAAAPKTAEDEARLRERERQPAWCLECRGSGKFVQIDNGLPDDVKRMLGLEIKPEVRICGACGGTGKQ